MSIIYYFTAGILFVISWLEDQRKRVIPNISGKTNSKHIQNRPWSFGVVLLTVYLVVVAGFRYGVGTDYWAYYSYYDVEWSVVWKHLLTFSDPGFYFLAFIARSIYNDGISLIFLCSLITISLFIRTIHKYSPWFLLAIMLYLFMGSWHGSFNGVRQYLASGILFAGHRYIFERKFKHYLGVVVLAMLFHRSAIVMLFPYFLFNRKLCFSQIAILVAGALFTLCAFDLVFGIVESLLGRGSDTTLSSYDTAHISFLRILVHFIPVLTYTIFARKEKTSAEENFYINALFFDAFVMLGVMKSAYLGRIGIYTTPMCTIGYAFLFKMISDKRLASIIIASALILYAIYWWYSIGITEDLRNYKFFFNRQW